VTNSDEPSIPEAEGGVGVWVLVPSPAAGDRITATLADRYATHDTLIVVVDGPPSEVLPRLRERVGGAPLGFVAIDEVAALDALSHGADEVLIWPAPDDRSIHGFFDRTQLRASLRRGQANHVVTQRIHANGRPAFAFEVLTVELRAPCSLQYGFERSQVQATHQR
jgi:hypothetical protein